ncbi:MAG: class I SAM-dependent methyltransferase [Actinomycetota bacterium]|jgi:2-polyprenyl-3-methyl-5-hydroxy-6-metoxy-1,4-benzoquinol methylase|nr:class I SAM-dependent methyltransferase [Actinomycetota bacterium]
MSSWADFYRESVSVNFHIRNLFTHLPIFDAVVARSPQRVLEVGVGTGGMSLFLASLGFEVTAIDNDLEVLARAAEVGAAVRTLHHQFADAFELGSVFAPGQFDVAFSQGFFEHFDDTDVSRLVDEQLKVAGRVVFSVPSSLYPEQDFGNERLLTDEQWRSILKDRPNADVLYYGFELTSSGEEQPMHVLAVIEQNGPGTDSLATGA